MLVLFETCWMDSAELHMVQLMSLPLTDPCFTKIHIGFTFPVPIYLANPRKKYRSCKTVLCNNYKISTWNEWGMPMKISSMSHHRRLPSYHQWLTFRLRYGAHLMFHVTQQTNIIAADNANEQAGSETMHLERHAWLT